MRIRLPKSIGASVAIVSVLACLQPIKITARNQSPAASVMSPKTGPMLMTSWREPDRQGIWTVESDRPLQRSLKDANPLQ